jgi:hypothetical protein
MSSNQQFAGISHMVNYQITENGDLKIHDGLYKMDYTLYNWKGCQYFHFWINENPVRTYNKLTDNSDVV